MLLQAKLHEGNIYLHVHGKIFDKIKNQRTFYV